MRIFCNMIAIELPTERAVMNDRECEATLVVYGNHGEDVFGRLMAIETLGRFRLGESSTLTLTDTYFDTDPPSLGPAQWALRLRALDEERLLTLKGPAAPGRNGAPTRYERELAFSVEALSEVCDKLRESAIVLKAPVTETPASPEAILLAMGLSVLQRRTTRRWVRLLYQEERPQLFGEMALDRVEYAFLSGTVVHYEVEVESLVESGDRLVMDVVNEIATTCPGAARRWDYGKLVTGRILQEAGRTGRLRCREGILKEEDYERMERSM